MDFNNVEKNKLVNSIFTDVHKKYDLMNDILSLGVHRSWKKNLIYWMKPSVNDKIIDVASGTGDLAKLCSVKNNNMNEISCVEPNHEMLLAGKEKLKKYKNISWFKAYAENLPFDENKFDLYIISFGLRNVSNLEKALREAHRVLKVGGRFYCLEFSKVENEILKSIYKQYSKIIPKIGKLIVGSEKPYKYLTESIKRFHDQKHLQELMKRNGFSNVKYRNLSNGVAAIHMGWKID